MTVDYKESRNLFPVARSSCRAKDRIRDLYSPSTFSPSNLTARACPCVQLWIAVSFGAVLKDFSLYGPEAHKIYLRANKGRDFKLSPGRSSFKILKPENVCVKEVTHLCSCSVPNASEVPSLPFSKQTIATRHVQPSVRNASNILSLKINVLEVSEF